MKKKTSRHIIIKFRSSARKKILKPTREKKDTLHTMKQRLTMTGNL